MPALAPMPAGRAPGPPRWSAAARLAGAGAVAAAAALGWPPAADGPAPRVDRTAPSYPAMAERLTALYPAGAGQALRIVRTVHAEADRHRLDPCLVMGVIARESGFRSQARNRRDLGLMQVNTRWHADRVARLGGPQALLDIDRNIRAGTEVLAHYRGISRSDVEALQRYHGLGRRNDYVARVLTSADTMRTVGACVAPPPGPFADSPTPGPERPRAPPSPVRARARPGAGWKRADADARPVAGAATGPLRDCGGGDPPTRGSIRTRPAAQASATTSTSMSKGSGQDPTVTKVRVGGSVGKYRA